MKFDMHVHTKESSLCGQIEGAKLAEYYKKSGYDGVVITDHFTRSSWDIYKGSYEEYCAIHQKGYLEAKNRGDEIGLTVLYGCELRFDENINDYLCYGMSNDFLINNPDIFSWNVEMFKKKADENGFVFYQAHPFRNGMCIVSPDTLFGIEVFNGKPYEDDHQRNSISYLWAERFGIKKITGSDCHCVEQIGTAGIDFYDKICDNELLLNALKNEEYMLVERVKKRPLITD